MPIQFPPIPQYQPIQQEPAGNALLRGQTYRLREDQNALLKQQYGQEQQDRQTRLDREATLFGQRQKQFSQEQQDRARQITINKLKEAPLDDVDAYVQWARQTFPQMGQEFLQEFGDDAKDSINLLHTILQDIMLPSPDGGTSEGARRSMQATQQYLLANGVKPEEGGTKSPLGKLISDYNALPEDSPFREAFKQKIEAAQYGETEAGTYSKKNEDGSVRTIKNVRPGSQQEKQLVEQGFVRGTQTVGVKPSVEERKEERLRQSVDTLSEQANIDPNKFYEEESFKQNDDGSLYMDPVSNTPVRLKPFYEATGRRGNITAIMRMGEQWDDAKELSELLELPSVQKNLQKANDDGLWNQVSGKWSNKITKWMQDSGISGDSPTATAVARIQRMTSEERKTFMGVAVTKLELQSALAWMPSAGDSFETIVNKTNLMGKEAEQEFRRWIDVFEGAGADMSPYTKAFGIKRFGEKSGEGGTPEQAAATQQKFQIISVE